MRAKIFEDVAKQWLKLEYETNIIREWNQYLYLQRNLTLASEIPFFTCFTVWNISKQKFALLQWGLEKSDYTGTQPVYACSKLKI